MRNETYMHLRRARCSLVALLVEEDVIHDVHNTVPQDDIGRHNLSSDIAVRNKATRAVEGRANALASRRRVIVARAERNQLAGVHARAVDHVVLKDRLEDRDVRARRREVLLNSGEGCVIRCKNGHAMHEVERVEETGLRERRRERGKVVCSNRGSELARQIDDCVDDIDREVTHCTRVGHLDGRAARKGRSGISLAFCAP